MAQNPTALIAVETDPFNAETPMEALASVPTPTALFYVRNHFDVPLLSADSWTVTIDGAVTHPLILSLRDLQACPLHAVMVTLECAGNGRKGLDPLPPGTPWMQGAVGTAWFSGTPLRTLLDGAGIRPHAVEAVFHGADYGEVSPGRTERFSRSLPLSVAGHPDTLLAWAMDDAPLSPEHGFPVRLIVPRWYGMASVKWLVGITVLTEPFNGHFQHEQYVYTGEPGIAGNRPVSLMRVRSVIAHPSDGAEVDLGPLEIVGTAWSGAGSIIRVEVSANGGLSWMKAELGTPVSPYAATAWRLLWRPPKPGIYVLSARATDSTGERQPSEQVWNVQGYGNNAIYTLHITVRANAGSMQDR